MLLKSNNYNGNYIIYDPAYLSINSFPSINKKLAEFDTLFIANYTIEELGQDLLILLKRKSNE